VTGHSSIPSGPRHYVHESLFSFDRYESLFDRVWDSDFSAGLKESREPLHPSRKKDARNQDTDPEENLARRTNGGI